MTKAPAKLQYLLLLLLLTLGLVVRLYKITNPIADWHSWRQADTSAVTRNFLKYGIDLAHPRYDDFSDVSGKGLYNPQGFRFVEFPVFNLIHHLLFTIGRSYGTLELWGRMTSVLSALTSATLLFFIVRRHSNAGTGLLSAFFYLFLPFNIYFTRVVLPDPLMVTFVLAAINFHDLWLRQSRPHQFVTASVFGALAVLVKPVAIFFLLPLLYSTAKTSKKHFLLLAVSLILPFSVWRLWSHRYPEGIPASLWLLNGNRIRFKPSFFQWIFSVRLGGLILGKWGLWPFLSGVLSAGNYFWLWVVSALLYLFTFATGNVHHDYYQIPIIPVVSVLLAIGTYRLWHTRSRTFLNRALLIVSLLFAFAFSWYDIRGLYQVNNYPIVTAGRAVDRLTPPDSVVVAPYGGDTAFLYQTNRPGFPYMYMPIKDMIDRFSADYYVSVNYDDDTRRIMGKYIVVEQTPHYVIVKLVEPIR